MNAEKKANEEKKREKEREQSTPIASENAVEGEENALPEGEKMGEEKSKMAELQARCATLLAEKEELHGQWIRARADFENYRRRSLADSEGALLRAKEKFFKNFLPILDDFARALSSQEKGTQSFIQGFQSIYDNTLKILKKEEITPMPLAVGDDLPSIEWIDVIAHQACVDKKMVGKVVAIVRGGFLQKGEPLLPAKIIVGK